MGPRMGHGGKGVRGGRRGENGGGRNLPRPAHFSGGAKILPTPPSPIPCACVLRAVALDKNDPGLIRARAVLPD